MEYLRNPGHVAGRHGRHTGRVVLVLRQTVSVKATALQLQSPDLEHTHTHTHANETGKENISATLYWDTHSCYNGTTLCSTVEHANQQVGIMTFTVMLTVIDIIILTPAHERYWLKMSSVCVCVTEPWVAVNNVGLAQKALTE